MFGNNTQDITEALSYIDPSCHYSEWLSVGMGLKAEGYTCDVWDEWSKSSSKYQAGLCEKKWESFKNDGVSIGTVFWLAKKGGWHPTYNIYVESHESSQDAIQQFSSYITTLHEQKDNVVIIKNSQYDEKKNKWTPADGGVSFSVHDLTQRIIIANSIEDIIGTYNHDAGVWIRINPMNGFGNSDKDVTAFKYALVESDEISQFKQKSLMVETLRLPLVALVDSGGKSIHGIVKIDATNEQEYRQRVEYLYDVCNSKGLTVDAANRNPSRMSRMPGVTRGNKFQRLIHLNVGCDSWDDWVEFIKAKEIGLPRMQTLSELVKHPPQLAEPLIDGLLRKGRKLLISGASKTGKSFALIQLAFALATGREWLGRKCAKTKVLYLNLEIANDSFDDRMLKVSQALGITQQELLVNDNIKWLNMRGINKPLRELSDSLIALCKGEGFGIIILDPIYKVSFANENDAQEMAEFCNAIDTICQGLQVSMAYCHHHSKGSQSGKSAIDRMSGSGVLARDPDCILDLLELEYTDEAKTILQDAYRKKTIRQALDTYSPGWLQFIPNEKDLEDVEVLNGCTTYRLTDAQKKEMNANVFAELESLDNIIPIQVSASVREFPPVQPTNVYFKYPLHCEDVDEAFIDARPLDQVKKDSSNSKKARKERMKRLYFSMADENGEVTISKMAKALNTTEKTVRNYLNECPEFDVGNGKFWDKSVKEKA